jgi:hypothetical protein
MTPLAKLAATTPNRQGRLQVTQEGSEVMNAAIANKDQSATDTSKRKFAYVAAFGLLAMAVLAPIAQFGILATLIVPTDATATATNIAGSLGLFAAAIALFFAVAILDVVVALALYVLLGPVNRTLARAVAALRVIYAAVFGLALMNLWNVVQLLRSSATPSIETTTQVTSSITSFNNVWDIGLAIFAFHLMGLGALLVRAPSFGRVIGGLVVIAGIGYAVDSLGRLLIADYSLTLSMVTFVGEALLIVWLFRLAIRGSRTNRSPAGQVTEALGAGA